MRKFVHRVRNASKRTAYGTAFVGRTWQFHQNESKLRCPASHHRTILSKRHPMLRNNAEINPPCQKCLEQIHQLPRHLVKLTPPPHQNDPAALLKWFQNGATERTNKPKQDSKKPNWEPKWHCKLVKWFQHVSEMTSNGYRIWCVQLLWTKVEAFTTS